MSNLDKNNGKTLLPPLKYKYRQCKRGIFGTMLFFLNVPQTKRMMSWRVIYQKSYELSGFTWLYLLS